LNYEQDKQNVELFISKYHKKSGSSCYMIYLALPVILLHILMKVV